MDDEKLAFRRGYDDRLAGRTASELKGCSTQYANAYANGYYTAHEDILADPGRDFYE